eukprot:4754047-Pyramimonas_sp.AAC.1
MADTRENLRTHTFGAGHNSRFFQSEGTTEHLLDDRVEGHGPTNDRVNDDFRGGPVDDSP